VATACDFIEPRWTLLILCELSHSATRLKEIRRGIPGISPTLLSKRLKEMERNGLVCRVEIGAGEPGYTTTPKADELQARGASFEQMGASQYRQGSSLKNSMRVS
jgi:DNA-binding HxlR family transcriptional regulator